MHFRKISRCTIKGTVNVVYVEDKKGPDQFKQTTF